MKPLFLFALILLNLWLFPGCKKEMADPIVSVETEKVNKNATPSANAGLDQHIVLPVNETILTGYASDPDDNIKSYKWEQVAGPSFSLLQNEETLTPRILNLEIGVYEFELTVTDSAALFDKDKVLVNVLVPDSLSQVINDSVSQIIRVSETEIIITNLQWIFPWYNSLEVEHFHKLIPTGNLFHLFIKRDNSETWVNVPEIRYSYYNDTTKYEYFIETRPDGAGMYHLGSLYIFYYGNDISDKPSIKIEL